MTSVASLGFPKLDPAFDGTWNPGTLMPYLQRAHISPTKKTIIFTATWDNGGISAIHQWIGVLPLMARDYNVLVTVHPWTSKKFVDMLKKSPGIFFIQDPDFLMLSDVLIGDTSSIIAEFCALDKPIITFQVPQSKRTVPEITTLLQEISIRISDADALQQAIELCLKQPDEKKEARIRANQRMFERLNGQAGQAAAKRILEWIPELK